MITTTVSLPNQSDHYGIIYLYVYDYCFFPFNLPYLFGIVSLYILGDPTQNMNTFFCILAGQEMNSWREKRKMVLLSFSSLMVATKQIYQISRGTRTNHGLYQVQPRTILFKSGRWLRASIVRMMTFEVFITH